MPQYHVIEELQTYLVAQGVGQLPNATPSTTVPSIWLQPRDGAPLPRDGENITVTLIDTTLGSPHDLEAWIEETFVDVIVRSRTAAPGKLVHRAIRGLLHPVGVHGMKTMWAMGAIDPVQYSSRWRAEQPLPSLQSLQSNVQPVTYDRVCSYRFGVERRTLDGQAYA